MLKPLNLALLASAVILAASLVARDAAAIDVDIDWTDSSLPTDFGYDTNHPTVDTSGSGTWTTGSSFPAGLHTNNDLVDAPESTVVHGFADISHDTFSTNPGSVYVVRFIKPSEFLLDVNVTENTLHVQHGEFGTSVQIPISNDDGQFHRYGWELDLQASVARVYFDDLQTPVGDPDGYSVTSTTTDREHWFGDREGVFHAEVWDRYVIKEGRIPEPTTAMLVSGLGLLAGLRRRARR